MTPQEKAKELYEAFENILHDYLGYDKAKGSAVKKCACEAVSRIIRENDDNDVGQNTMYSVKYTYTINEFYEIVKEEINRL